MRVVLINPWSESVLEINTPSWSIDVIYELLTHDGRKPVDDFNIVELGKNVMLYVDGEGFLKQDIPVWYVLGHSSGDQLRPLAGMGILFGGPDTEGDDLPLPEYISEKFCHSAVTWSKKLSTGTLEPTVEKPGMIIIGQPILKEASDG